MRIALIGLPAAGRKTLFALLTGRVPSASRRSGEAIEGGAPIRDERVDRLAELCRPRRKVYAENNFVLCPDAVLDGRERGWLEAARKCDLLCLVVRGFHNEAVYHPGGSIDAGRDLRQLQSELLLADLERVETRLERIDGDRHKRGLRDMEMEKQSLLKASAALQDECRLADVHWRSGEIQAIKSLELLTLIPSMAVFNVGEEDVGRGCEPGSCEVSALIEAEIAEIDDASERREYLQSLGLTQPGIDRVNSAAYESLGLMSFYTVGPDEVRAWTVRRGASAPEAAGKIHSDIERGFIRVEVIKYDDFIAAGSESEARRRGKVQTRGKDYVIESGDICNFLFNV